MKKRISVFIMLMLLGTMMSAETFGALGAISQTSYSLEEMMRYALEDEHMALAEYEALMEKYGLTRPYSNIAESEKTHIAYLEELYRNYNMTQPLINVEDHLVIPAGISEAAEIGVQAEINNIAMYELFLEQDLPEDVRDVFTFLKRASENHLSAFQKQVAAVPGRSRNRA